MRTQVAIIGAGPAGLLLAHLLDREGIESLVLESRDRSHVESRIRAGVLEQGSVDVLRDLGLADRLEREGLEHDGIELRFGGGGHRIDFPSLTGGRRITVYGQQEVVKDLIAARVAAGGPILFDTRATAIEDLDGDRPVVVVEQGGETKKIRCDFVAGCDGFHGISRGSIPTRVLREFERVYPFAWLGVLAEAEPSSQELIYAHSRHGFALHSMRSASLSRNYVQVDNDASLDEWDDDRFWTTFSERMATAEGFAPNVGPIVDRSIAHMRSYVAEPMQYGRLYLAGDAAHIVPATGAKGMNLAMRDVRILAAALAKFYGRGSTDRLNSYSDECLRSVWRAQHFSWWMTSMLHRFPGDDEYGYRLQLAQLRYLAASEAAARSLAENYVGWQDPDSSLD